MKIFKYSLQKTFLLILLLMSVTAYAQPSSEALKEGVWEEYAQTNRFSEDLLADMIKHRKKEQGKLNGNSSFYTFSKDGSFNLASIKDYGLNNIDGNYEFDDTGKKIIVKISKKNALNNKVKVGKAMVFKILSLDNDILVLKHKGKVTYFYLSNNR